MDDGAVLYALPCAAVRCSRSLFPFPQCHLCCIALPIPSRLVPVLSDLSTRLTCQSSPHQEKVTQRGCDATGLEEGRVWIAPTNAGRGRSVFDFEFRCAACCLSVPIWSARIPLGALLGPCWRECGPPAPSPVLHLPPSPHSLLTRSSRPKRAERGDRTVFVFIGRPAC